VDFEMPSMQLMNALQAKSNARFVAACCRDRETARESWHARKNFEAIDDQRLAVHSAMEAQERGRATNKENWRAFKNFEADNGLLLKVHSTMEAQERGRATANCQGKLVHVQEL
jgi:hypothetical protein